MILLLLFVVAVVVGEDSLYIAIDYNKLHAAAGIGVADSLSMHGYYHTTTVV